MGWELFACIRRSFPQPSLRNVRARCGVPGGTVLLLLSSMVRAETVPEPTLEYAAIEAEVVAVIRVGDEAGALPSYRAVNHVRRVHFDEVLKGDPGESDSIINTFYLYSPAPVKNDCVLVFLTRQPGNVTERWRAIVTCPLSGEDAAMLSMGLTVVRGRENLLRATRDALALNLPWNTPSVILTQPAASERYIRAPFAIAPADSRLKSLGERWAREAIPRRPGDDTMAFNAITALTAHRSPSSAQLLRQLRSNEIVRASMGAGRLTWFYDCVWWNASGVLQEWNEPFDAPILEPDDLYVPLSTGLTSGAGLAGALLIWRIARSRHGVLVVLARFAVLVCVALFVVLISFGVNWKRSGVIGGKVLDLHLDRSDSQTWVSVLDGRLQIDRIANWPGSQRLAVAGLRPNPAHTAPIVPRGLRVAVLDRGLYRALWDTDPDAWSSRTNVGVLTGSGVLQTTYKSPTVRLQRVRIPIAYPLILVGLPVAVWLINRIRLLVRRQRRLRAGKCVACGYDLRASPKQCPECGALVSSRGPCTV